MIFSGPLYGKVLRGEKTQTRRPASSSDPANRYRPGMRRAVQKGRGIHGEAHIIITDVRLEAVGDITFEDARAEGFRTRDDFKAYWIELHDKKWLEREEEENGDWAALKELRILARFDQRHAHKQVWVLTFELDRTERPRLLADRNAKTDYVDAPARALDHEPEAIDATTQNRFSQEGHKGWMARESQREIDRERMAAEERLRQVRIDARAQGVDITHLEAAIVERIRRAERKIRQRRAA